jgi:hypothetical protein
MQTDVKAGHLNLAGFVELGRVRLKGLVLAGNATGGTINVWNSTSAPVTSGVTYTRTAATITVTKTAHGLVVGQKVGLTFAIVSAAAGTNGNYVIATVADANTFTVTDINSGTVGSGAASYVATNTSVDPWMLSYDTPAVLCSTNVVIPGEGIVADKGLYLLFTANITAVTVFYG